MEDSPEVIKLHGVLVNTFEALESQSLEALNAGKVVRGMPPDSFGKGPNKRDWRWVDEEWMQVLWVVKDKIVDREEQEVGLDEVLGIDMVERMREKGLVVKEWVDQSEILGHKAVGGMEWCVPILAWPQHGDQKINAGLVEVSGWGIWNNNWGWAGERVVKGEEIGEAIKEMMKNQSLKIKATQLKEAGRKATSIGGDCEVTLHKLIEEWKKKC
ncbi:putative anthocyanidin 5,3-O-glucosyltransferase [Sesbania bispinosa]|nr:putative anthocyanidin 5,3-O-glucosyltransferase [Sesbania bispinosa]